MTEILTAIVNSVPWWVRLLLAVACLVAGGLVFWFASIQGGVLLLGVGVILLMFSGRTKAEKNGYNF